MLPPLSLFLFAVGAAAAVPYQEYILAPSSRTLRPTSIYRRTGSVSSESSLLDSDSGVDTGGRLILGAFNSSVTYDFGKNIAGWVNFNTTSDGGSLGVTFSESSVWVSSEACDGTRGVILDAPMEFNITGAGHYAAPDIMERGAFRYVTLVNHGSDALSIDDLWVHFGAMPHWPDDSLQNYTGWFNSNDEKLNRVWYAGAYTLQMITIDPTRGNAIIYSDATNADGLFLWWLNGTVSNGTSMLTDGAKRDRLAWSADMSVSVPGVAVTTFDLISARNAFDAFFDLQSADGMLPYGGFPFNLLNDTSFTYHVYALIGVWNVYHWSGDQSYVDDKWVQWKAGMEWAVAQIDDSGLANITAPYDWLRYGMGGHNIEANTLLFHALNLGVALAHQQNDSATAERWAQLAARVQSAAMERLWQPDVGLFKDNETTTLAPQDGNTWAVKSGLVADAAQVVQISEALEARWGPYGAPSPEVDAVSPFTSSFELETHFMANRTGAALELIRRMWADFMLDDPRMTNSTLVEGFSMDGELHYPAYASDAVISHAHAFSTGPTSSLMTYVGGIQLLSGAGATWAIVPQVGDLNRVDAGFSTSLGVFSSKWSTNGTAFRLEISTPEGTTGTVGVSFPGNYTSAVLTGTDLGIIVVTADDSGKYWIEDVAGGDREYVVVGL